MAWRSLLERVERSYEDAEQNRYLLERSLQISSQEMRDLYEELKRSSEAREQEQETRLRAVVDSLSDGLCTLDSEGRVAFANPSAARLLGLTPADMRGTRILSRFRFLPDHPAEHVTPGDVLKAIARGEHFSDDTALLLAADGQVVPVACVVNPIRTGNGAERAVLLFSDLTERREALEAIHRTEQHYHTLFHALPIAVYEEDFSAVGRWLDELRTAGVTDIRSYLESNRTKLREAISLVIVKDVNPAVLDMLEADHPSQLLGPLNPQVFTEETLNSMMEQLIAIWEDRDSVLMELTGATLQNNRLDAIFQWSASRIGGRLDLSKVLVAVTDITARKLVEDQMASLVRSKDEFLASVSHELRTPLTAVYGSAEVLLEEWGRLPSDERLELVGYIASESRELANIVEDLLVAARADIGSLTVKVEPMDIRVEVESALRAVSTNETPHEIDLEQLEGWVIADPLRFRQIIRNLVTNALRYGGSQVTLHSKVADGYLALSVKDDGAGVPADQREAIFEPYHRAHIANGVPGSVGLGLTVARQLAVLMGGELRYVRSGSLSSFDLTLPAATEPAHR
ncbi:MAG: ATP-binding protein [Acidimicrobiia bacterium]|nr:ATP-binding protein [Acidimicrobiia bacterium]